MSTKKVVPDTTRVTADFDPEAYAALKEVADLMGTTKAEAIRKSLGLSRYVLRQKKEGKKLLIEGAGGQDRLEIITI